VNAPSPRLLTGLWCFAAFLALVAFAIGYFKSGTVDWVPLVATFILAGVGIASARRNKPRG